VTARPAASAPSTTPSTSPVATAALPVLIGGAVGLVALGFVIGAGGSFLQARTLGLGVRWPFGALFAVLVLAAVGFSAGLLARSRLGLGMVAAGWVISVLVFTAGRPEGDVIIAADVPGYLYLFGGVAALGVVSVVPFGALPEPPPSASEG
jgi:hypothetical protein